MNFDKEIKDKIREMQDKSINHKFISNGDFRRLELLINEKLNNYKKNVKSVIDKEAKEQYNEFVKETGLKLQPNGWKDWKLDRKKIKQRLQDIK